MKAVMLAITMMAASVSAYASTTDDILDFGDKFRAKYQNELVGKTAQGNKCVLSSFDKSWKGQAQDNRPDSPTKGEVLDVNERSAYLSLGVYKASRYGGEFWIGFFVNPGISYTGHYEVKAIEVTSTLVHMSVLADEITSPARGGSQDNVQNDLSIESDADGNITRAVGTSSYWPAIDCVFPKASN